ncbi:MAG: hypothetical protein H0W70_04970 [Actinobacteria bacterium]|nr:hypothetical protein [Actinomycetota bacterium]
MRGAAAAALAVVMTACVPHPVGPARTFGKYEGKAKTTAESALSAVRNAQLVSDAASRHRLFGPYVSQALGESEDALAGLDGTFGSIQPPSAEADTLRAELRGLLAAAEDHLSDLRVAARRGDIAHLAEIARPLEADAAHLDDFVASHE